ncbi:pyroglutamyl-peptidase I [Undibacterium sp. SXout20W]|uniref:pyroglutamyl-peptidase I n=1 Tax=Undibacterium sp. SXout20W TaxID=3413051 RepID=UPI003BF1F2E2
MRKILLTGFSPFAAETTNPSWDAVVALDGAIVDGAIIVSLQLPCEFDRSLQVLEQAIQQHQPELVLSLGQAGGRVDVTVERVAINVNDARIPDNAGQQPIDTAVIEHGPVGYFSSLPIKAIVEALHEQGIPASVSHTAGTYVCNHVFYGLMHLLPQYPTVKRAGFVHVPYAPKQAAAHPGMASMAVTTMTKAIRLIIETSLHTAHDIHVSGGITH